MGDMSLTNDHANDISRYVRCTLQTCQQFLSLKDQCVHPESKKPYLRSLLGGRDNSPEGLAVRTVDICIMHSTSLLRILRQCI